MIELAIEPETFPLLQGGSAIWTISVRLPEGVSQSRNRTEKADRPSSNGKVSCSVAGSVTLKIVSLKIIQPSTPVFCDNYRWRIILSEILAKWHMFTDKYCKFNKFIYNGQYIRKSYKS